LSGGLLQHVDISPDGVEVVRQAQIHRIHIACVGLKQQFGVQVLPFTIAWP